jgi:hypothetical protein
LIENHFRSGHKIVLKSNNPVEILALSIIGQNTNALMTYSPLFQNNREQASRIEYFTLLSLLSDFSDTFPWSLEEILSQVRKWQLLDNKFIEQLKTMGKNPFGNLAGYFLCEIYGHNVISLCQKGTTNIDQFLLTNIADLYTILCSSSFSYWKTTLDKYELICEIIPDEIKNLYTFK